MTNFEKFKDEIIRHGFNDFRFDGKTIEKCVDTANPRSCSGCIFENDGEKNCYQKETEWLDHEYVEPKRNQSDSNDRRGKKPVIQMDKNFNVLARYESIYSASKITMISEQKISDVCNEVRKSTGGYRWKFADAIEKKEA